MLSLLLNCDKLTSGVLRGLLSHLMGVWVGSGILRVSWFNLSLNAVSHLTLSWRMILNGVDLL